ncbi:hypothetical protein FRY98_25920 [Paenibacillus faecis]|uniref:Uncharacterized protein n=1 Tax=Paenibacillus faecis TaxID=862114 RepID=A0A5D0CK31_9BACL|nr:hypothetical protein FRY98_25920 [Paenibacillus faecis]
MHYSRRFAYSQTHALQGATFVFAPYPVLQKGETPKFGQEAWLYAESAVPATSKGIQTLRIRLILQNDNHLPVPQCAP